MEFASWTTISTDSHTYQSCELSKKLQISEQSTLIIDGQALVAASFGDLAYIFVKCNHVKCNDSVDITQLRCFHEEGDTNYLCIR